jgi:hypothetical protein
MTKRSAPIGSVMTNARNRLSNSSGRHLADVSGRGQWMRRFRAIFNQHLEDRGGIDAISVAEMSILRRVATIETELGILETRFAAAGGADGDGIDLYQRTANSLRRLFEAIGMQRRSKDITPSLVEYLAEPK